MRVNRQIRAPRVRLIDHEGNQVGVVTIMDAQRKAEDAKLDLVEISPKAQPPVCKIVDYGKFRYEQAKKEKEHKRSQQQSKLKEVKMKPNIDTHDYDTKLRRARDFLEKGHKVRVTCMFRGREMAHPEVGRRVMQQFVKDLEEISQVEAFPKMMGRMLTMVIAPGVKKGNQKKKPDQPGGREKTKEKESAQS